MVSGSFIADTNFFVRKRLAFFVGKTLQRWTFDCSHQFKKFMRKPKRNKFSKEEHSFVLRRSGRFDLYA